jgi:hypothetical protein
MNHACDFIVVINYNSSFTGHHRSCMEHIFYPNDQGKVSPHPQPHVPILKVGKELEAILDSI